MKTEKIDYKNVEKFVFEYLDEILKNKGVEKLTYKERSEVVQEEISDGADETIFTKYVKKLRPVYLEMPDMDAIYNGTHGEKDDVEVDMEGLKNFIDEAIEYYGLYCDSQQLKLCHKFFPKKENRSLITAIAVLQIFFTVDKLKKENLIPKEKEENEADADLLDSSSSKSAIEGVDTLILTEVFKLLRCNNLIEKNGTSYSITKNLYNDDIRFQIKDKHALKPLAPLLFTYIRTSSKLYAEDFFEIIDELIEFLLQPSLKHNGYETLERMIYHSIISSKTITIYTNDEKQGVKIHPIRIEIYNKRKTKMLHYQDKSNDTQKIIPLSQINSIQTSNNEQFTPSNNMSSSYFMANVNQVNKADAEIQKKENVILAVNFILYEYFQSLTIFEEMEFITDKLEVKNQLDLPMNKQIDKIFIDDLTTASADFFLLKLTDEYEFIVQEIQKNLQYIKVISPQSIKHTIASNLSTFSKNLAL